MMNVASEESIVVETEHGPVRLPPMAVKALRSWEANRAAIEEFAHKQMAGVTPMGAIALRELLIAGGYDPTSTEFSRELIAARDE